MRLKTDQIKIHFFGKSYIMFLICLPQKMNLSSKEQMKAEVTKIYTCPMHPEVALDKDGTRPKCGIALVEKKQ
ncbi:hypothetical protein BH11BAC5_BH11BAC5_40840 [soil metagenome]